MKLTQLLERLEYEVVQGDDQIEVTELINDSRKVSEGSVFVCISGAVSDGHTYIEQVAEKGAAAVIVEKDVEAPEGLTVIKVKDTRYALAMTSAAYFGYPAEKLKVIGNHRNQRQDNNNIHGQIYPGRSRYQSRTDRYDRGNHRRQEHSGE